MAYRKYIYIAGEPGGTIIKIGRSVSPQARVDELRKPGYALTPDEVDRAKLELLAWWRGDNRTERWLHRRFRNQRIAGEWFSIDIAAVDAAIRSQPASYRTGGWLDPGPPLKRTLAIRTPRIPPPIVGGTR